MTKEKVKRLLALVLAGMCVVGMSGCNLFKKKTEEDKGIILKNVQTAKNVILMIGDGMGPNQIRAGEVYKEEKLAMQKFPYSVKVETRSASAIITDSAAAATALATGVRTANNVVGKDLDGNELETIVDIAAKLGKRTGIITTEELYGATPMGFSSHNDSRGASFILLTKAASDSNVNLFLSHRYKPLSALAKGGYVSIENPEDISEATSDKVSGAYTILAEVQSMSLNPDFTSLDGLVVEALEYLSKDEDGFFLMTEGAHIDHGGHNNDFEYMLSELMAFDMAVEAVLEWAKDRDDTVVIVTADHETGGLQLSDKITKENMFEGSNLDVGYYEWTTSGHTPTDVWCYINGADIDFSKYTFGNKDRIANTDIFQIMKSLMGA